MKYDPHRESCAKRELKGLLRPLVSIFRENAFRLKRSLLGKNVEALLVNTEQGLFLVGPEDRGVGGVLIENGKYGEDEIERIVSLTDEKSSVLIVGSHIGALAIPIASHPVEEAARREVAVSVRASRDV
jgi:hypothetical protein